MLTVGQVGNPTAAELMMLPELVRLSRAVHDMYATANDARRATAVRGALLEQLRLLVQEAELRALPPDEQARQARLAANRGASFPGAGRLAADAADRGTAVELTKAEQAARNRVAANRAWADGDPVPAPPPAAPRHRHHGDHRADGGSAGRPRRRPRPLIEQTDAHSHHDGEAR